METLARTRSAAIQDHPSVAAVNRQVAVGDVGQSGGEQDRRRAGWRKDVGVERDRIAAHCVQHGLAQRTGTVVCGAVYAQGIDSPVHQMRRTDGRIFERDVCFDQGGAIVKIDRNHCCIILYQDSIRLLKVDRPQSLVRLYQRHVDQFSVADAVPTGELVVGIRVEHVVQHVVGVSIVHAPPQPVRMI